MGRGKRGGGRGKASGGRRWGGGNQNGGADIPPRKKTYSLPPATTPTKTSPPTSASANTSPSGVVGSGKNVDSDGRGDKALEQPTPHSGDSQVQSKPHPIVNKVKGALRFSPKAWSKLVWFRDRGNTEIGGFAVTSIDDPLYVKQFLTVPQRASVAFVKFGDTAVNDYLMDRVEEGLHPAECLRIWLHTHPNIGANPSGTDEDTFRDAFGAPDWAIMFILAKGGEVYARLKFNVGPGHEQKVPVVIDYATMPFEGVTEQDLKDWEAEYKANVTTEYVQHSTYQYSGYGGHNYGQSRQYQGQGWGDPRWSPQNHQPPAVNPSSHGTTPAERARDLANSEPGDGHDDLDAWYDDLEGDAQLPHSFGTPPPIVDDRGGFLDDAEMVEPEDDVEDDGLYYLGSSTPATLAEDVLKIIIRNAPEKGVGRRKYVLTDVMYYRYPASTVLECDRGDRVSHFRDLAKELPEQFGDLDWEWDDEGKVTDLGKYEMKNPTNLVLVDPKNRQPKPTPLTTTTAAPPTPCPTPALPPPLPENEHLPTVNDILRNAGNAPLSNTELLDLAADMDEAEDLEGEELFGAPPEDNLNGFLDGDVKDDATPVSETEETRTDLVPITDLNIGRDGDDISLDDAVD